ncbi:MAG: hypothetical protein IPP07_17920 [Holophagales bacterium]|nr:hypothetical protein [Holophagales bacterium]MBK9966648.1 hypothetical protein [Holophagales bacterium]
MSTVQISAHISEATKSALERFAEARGLKKGFVIEDAILHHLQALREVPEDLLVPVRLVVSEASLARIVGRVERPRRPTPAMRKLMKGSSRG